MLPAEQGFGSDETTTGNLDLWLIMQYKLFLIYRSLNFLLQNNPPSQLFLSWDHYRFRREDGSYTDVWYLILTYTIYQKFFPFPFPLRERGSTLRGA